MEVPQGLEEILKPVVDLQKTVDDANRALKAAGATIQSLDRMLGVAMDEMVYIAQDSETPIKIRARLVNKLQAIKAIGLP